MKTVAQIKTTINGIARRNAKLRDDVQACVVDIAEHIFAHGDVSLAGLLFDKLKGSDRKALAKWLTTYAACRLEANGTFKLNKKMRAETEFNREYLAGEPTWYEMGDTAEQIAKALDVVKGLNALTKRVEKSDELVPADRDALNAAVAELLRAVEVRKEAA